EPFKGDARGPSSRVETVNPRFWMCSCKRRHPPCPPLRRGGEVDRNAAQRAMRTFVFSTLAGHIAAAVVLSITGVTLAADRPATEITFDGQIRPILSNNCFKCHGPEADQRESGLRLDLREDALNPAESGKRAIVPGKPEASRMTERIFATDRGEI